MSDEPNLPKDAVAVLGGTPRLPSRAPWIANVIFLVMLVVGGLLASWLRGDLVFRWDLGETFHGLMGHGLGMWLALLFGGVLAGFGAKMAGGCPSWHGFYGTPRFQIGSMVTLAMFFAGAIGTSLALVFLR